MSTSTELFLIDEDVLIGRVIPAISDFLERSDPAAANQLVHEAMLSQQFLTALKSHEVADAMIARYLAKESLGLLEGKLPYEILDDTGERIRDRDTIRKRQVKRILSPFLVMFLCSSFQDGIETAIPLGHTRLTYYLRSKSVWIDDMLQSSNELLWGSPDLPLPITGEAKLLTQQAAGVLLAKLNEVPLPLQDKELCKEYKMLEQLLQIAAQNFRFRILIRTT